MDFKYKSTEEIAKLSNEELDAYTAQLKKHEADLRQKEISTAVEAAKADLNAEIKKANDANIALEEQIKELKDLQVGGAEKKGNGVLGEFHKTRVEADAYKKEVSGNVTIKAAALMTTANVAPNVVGGFNQLFGNYIDGELYAAPKNNPFILPLVDVRTQEGTEKIWFVERVNNEGDAEFIGEGDLKPLADGEAIERSADIKEVAIRWKFSKRLMNNAPAFVSDFNEHAGELVDLKIDSGVLSGSGSGDNLEGILTASTPFIAPTELALYYTNTNIFDAINAVATRVRLNNFKGSLTCVLNTVWKAKMQGIKRTDGTYIIPPFVTQDGKTVGEVNVIFENGMDETKILLGDLKKFKVVISQNAEYAEGWEGDDFSKNLVSRRIDAYLGTYIPNNLKPAIIADDIATVLTQITKP